MHSILEPIAMRRAFFAAQNRDRESDGRCRSFLQFLDSVTDYLVLLSLFDYNGNSVNRFHHHLIFPVRFLSWYMVITGWRGKADTGIRVATEYDEG
jgi:hypothetical protein